jgi:hypothetical protein
MATGHQHSIKNILHWNFLSSQSTIKRNVSNIPISNDDDDEARQIE